MPGDDQKPVNNAAVAAILEAGERLLAVLAEEHRISQSFPKDISKVFEYSESVSRARKNVDECAEKYCAVLAQYGCPDVPIRHRIEEGENRRRWNWPPVAT